MMTMLRLVMVLALCGAVACNGADGAPGAPGRDGKDGKDGSGLLSDSYCTSTGGGAALALDVYRFRDGSTMHVCNVAGGVLSTSNTYMYMASQAGSATGYCALGADLDDAPYENGGYWVFGLASPFAQATATYHDKGNALDGHVFILPCVTY